MPDEATTPSPDDAVDRHVAELIAKAIAIVRVRPDERVVGLVAEADAPEAPALRATLPESSRDPNLSVAVIMTRESVLRLLGDRVPGLLDWLEDEGDGPRRRLPVLHAARRGMRTTVLEYDLPE